MSSDLHKTHICFGILTDYHRYHSPVDGVIGKPTRIEGQYYTVNPQAIRTTLDVYGENVREVWPIHSPQFGTVMTVWIGAMSKSTRSRFQVSVILKFQMTYSGRQYRRNG